MTRLFSLDGRLDAARGFVEPADRIIDVCCDHALLPAYLLLTGVCKNALCVDISEGSLSAAKRTAERYGLEDRLETRVSDGLDAVLPHEADEIILTGIGGELIEQILSRASWIRSDGVRLILQPQTRPEAVRRFLAANGFSVWEEKAVISGGFSYIVFCSDYNGLSRELDETELYFGPLCGRDDPASEAAVRLQRKLLDARNRFTVHD